MRYSRAAKCRVGPERAAIRTWLTRIIAFAALVSPVSAVAEPPLLARALEIEPAIQAFPQRSVDELAVLIVRAETAASAERRFIYALYGQANVLAGNTSKAADLADQLEAEAKLANDRCALATALLIRRTIESSAGDEARSIALAREARALAADSDDGYVKYWAALALGTSARMRGQPEEALASLHDALSWAEKADNAFRRSSALYQLAVLQLALKNGQQALTASVAAYKDAEAAKSVYALVNARMAESYVMELLERPARELSAMHEALSIAQKAGSQAAEARALINLADIRLRRNQFVEALDLSRRSLVLAQKLGDGVLVAISKANAGFALLGLGRIAEGKLATDEALAQYERTGATADIVELIVEYGRHLEQLGDYKGALGLYHRARKLNDEIALQTRQRAIYEVQEKYESEKRRREIDLLNRENELQSAEIASREQVQRVWWLLVALFALSFIVVALLYRKLRLANDLLARRNAELSIQSSRDPLTGLYNRRYFQTFISAEKAQPERRRRDDDNAAHVLLLIDIDHFKETNDRFGHALGDAVLVAVAERLRETLRESDMIVRWGGEEFLIFATTTDAERIEEIAKRILLAVSAKPITLDDKVIRTTASIGYIPMPLPPSDVPLSWDRAIALTDMALYMAKVNGRNRAYGIRRLVRGDEQTLASVERDLDYACKAGMVELDVVYGPSPVGDVSVAMHAVRAEPTHSHAASTR